jgi:hypothetical protein
VSREPTTSQRGWFSRGWFLLAFRGSTRHARVSFPDSTAFSADAFWKSGGIFLSCQIIWTGWTGLASLPAWFLPTFTQLSRWHRREASERHHRIYRESTRQAFLKARDTVENHPFYRLVRRLDGNNFHLKVAVNVAKELGKPNQEIPPAFSQAVENLLTEADTGNPALLEQRAA